jgi:DNA-binding GntR family transcriptional regulator
MKIPGVVQTVLDRLKSQLITWRLKPAQKLNEQELASSLGISRPPLREAFRILTEQRLVKTIPRKGVYVADVSIQDLRELSVVREALECCALDIFAARNQRTFKLLARASSDNAQRVNFRALEEDNRLKSLVSLTDFHMKLIEEANNSWLAGLYRSISTCLMRYQYLYFSKGGTYRESLKNHRRILAALRRGNYDEAKRCIRSHVWTSFQSISRDIAEETASES